MGYGKQTVHIQESGEGGIGGSNGRSRGESADGGQAAGRSRILRVQTRSGSASGTDLLKSPVLNAIVFDSEDIPQSPLIKANSEPADLSSLGRNAADFRLPKSIAQVGEQMTHSAGNQTNNGVDNEPLEETGLSRRFLSSATVFDLLDIHPHESDYSGSADNADGGRANEALIFMMAVPTNEDSYQEVEFEFNLLLDEPGVVVEEMQLDPDLADTIKPYATNMIAVLTAVCEVAKRVAVERIAVGRFSSSLSTAVLTEILRMNKDEDSYTQYVDCSDSDSVVDPLAALRSVARTRLPAIADHTNADDCAAVADSDADLLLFEDAKYIDLLAVYQENLSRFV